jgi:hypothetical protein
MTLNLDYGKIEKVGTGFVVIDQAPDMDLIPGSYANVIDHRTGELIGQLQVKRVVNGKVEFRDTPDRQVVNGEAVTTMDEIQGRSLPTQELIKEDDYLVPSGCTNIPFMMRPLSNYYISYAEGEIRRKLGETTELQERATQSLMQTVESMWVGRETTHRVANRSSIWTQSLGRLWRGRSR